MAKRWRKDELLGMVRGSQPACVLAAGAELGVFEALADGPMTVAALAGELGTDVRATAMLADALAAMQVLAKADDAYALAPDAADVLTSGGADSAAAMVLHLGNCLRSWAELATVVKTGSPAQRRASTRGEQADLAAFIGAMDDISSGAADELVAAIGPPEFRHLLDIGGGPGTWTIAFLRARPGATATLLDLPDVLPIARRHIEAAGLADRVTLAAGDMHMDALPAGADLAWASAIVHQNSRRQNRELFARTRSALADGGQVLIRDVLVDAARTSPPRGAMFAINMLVRTHGGGVYTFDELSEDLTAAGFPRAELLRAGEFMDSVIRAVKA